MNLSFGLGHAVPEAVTSAWGARLIFPDDLVFNRQSAEGPQTGPLIAWLNDGPLRAALQAARKASDGRRLSPAGSDKVILYQDADGVIVGCPNASHGYLYVAGWLHGGDAAKQPPEGFQELAR